MSDTGVANGVRAVSSVAFGTIGVTVTVTVEPVVLVRVSVTS